MVKFLSITTDTYEIAGPKMGLLYAFHPTPFGKCLIAVTNTDKAVAYLGFVDGTEAQALRALEKEWSLSKVSKDTENEIKNIVEEIFGSDASSLDSICVLLKGTDFQVRVWKSLIDIPKGTSTTYEKVAKMIDNPKAIRAVGNAISKNRVAYIVPCHRVRGKTGSNKYTWGVERKEALLKYERQ